MREPMIEKLTTKILAASTLCLFLILSGSGCGSSKEDVTTYAPDDGDLGIPSVTYKQPRKTLESVLIVPVEDLSDFRLIEHIIQIEVGSHHWAFHVEKPQPTDLPDKQAKLIRAAVDRGVSSLIVVPGEPTKDLISALEYARDEKIPIVLLERNVPISGKPIPAILFGSYEKPAKQLVDALIEDAKANKLPADAPAILIQRIPGDMESNARIAAIEAELKKANVPVVEKLTFSGVTEDAKKVVDEALARHPNISMILADEDQGLNAAAQALGSTNSLPDDDPKRLKFGVAGFVISKSRLVMVDNGSANALAERSLVEMAQQAVDYLAAISGGKSVPAETYSDTQFHRRSADALERRRIRKRAMETGEPEDESKPKKSSR